MGRPSVGSWVLYGLGTQCDNLPGYVVLSDYFQEPPAGSRQWSTGFMPATYQGTQFRDGKTPILHVTPPEGYSDARERSTIDYIQQLNRQHRVGREDDENLEARIASLRALAQCKQPGATEVNKFKKTPPNPPPLTGLTIKPPPPMAAIACWPAGWSSAACASCSSTAAPAASGTPTATSKATTPHCARSRQADRGLLKGPETARPAWTARWSSGAANSAARR